jgi:integrase
MDYADQSPEAKTPGSRSPADRRPKLLDRVRAVIRTLHYSIRTEDAYVQWIKRFILFHGKRHPLEMGEREVETFLTYLAVEGNVAASTQNQAMSALLFLYKAVLDRPLRGSIDASRAKRPERLPVVLTRVEVRAILAQLDGDKLLMASLLYGSGLRIIDVIGNKESATFSAASCDSAREGCAIRKPLPSPHRRLLLSCSARHPSRSGSA